MLPTKMLSWPHFSWATVYIALNFNDARHHTAQRVAHGVVTHRDAPDPA